MKKYECFIRTKEQFDLAQSELLEIFDFQKEFPENPFNSQYSNYQFEEFDWMLSGEFWPVLKEVANRSLDNKIALSVIDPDPEKYFFSNFGFYNWAELSTAMTTAEYWEIINIPPVQSPADSILVNSEKLFIYPSSKKWAIFGSRSEGLCVLGSKYDMPNVGWRDLEWAADISQGSISQDFAVRIQKNFK